MIVGLSETAQPSRSFPKFLTGWSAAACFVAAMLVAEFSLFASGKGDVFWSLAHKNRAGVLFALFDSSLFVLATLLARTDALKVIASLQLRWLCLAAILLTTFVGAWSLQSFPNSGDEYAYVFQAATYAGGHVWNPAPPLGEAMGGNYTWVVGEKWAGSYLPGWPLVLAPFVAAGGAGWTANLLLLPLALGVLYDLVARRAGREAAIAAALLFASSPFTLFNAASFFPHLFSATLILLACWSADRLIEREQRRFGLLMGLVVGVLGITRMIDAVIVLIALSPTLLGRSAFWKRWIASIALGGLPFIAILLAYQFALSGNALQPTYYFGGRAVDHLYFDGASVIEGVKLTVKRCFELVLWASPATVLLAVGALALKAKGRTLAPLDLLMPTAVLVFMFYPFDGGNRYGPRYYFDAWSSLPFTIATALPLIPTRLRNGVGTAIGLSVVYSAAMLAPLAWSYHMIVDERQDLYRGAQLLPGADAAVCIRSSSGLHSPLDTLDLARNGTRPFGHVLYVRCSPGMPALIRAAYPTRTLWYYERGKDDLHGRFVRDAQGTGGKN